MEKVELLKRIQKLATLVHSNDLNEYKFAEGSVEEMRRALDELTEKYIATYC